VDNLRKRCILQILGQGTNSHKENKCKTVKVSQTFKIKEEAVSLLLISNREFRKVLRRERM
jgi:hypothetical protein